MNNTLVQITNTYTTNNTIDNKLLIIIRGGPVADVGLPLQNTPSLSPEQKELHDLITACARELKTTYATDNSYDLRKEV